MFIWTIIKESLHNSLHEEDIDKIILSSIKNCILNEDSHKCLPSNVLKLISEYSKPVTRPDWRKGSPLSNIFKYSPIMVKTHTFLKKVMPDACKKHDNLADLIVNVGSDRVFQMYEYMFDYTNFYFYLICEDNSFLIKKPVLKKTGNFKIKRRYQNNRIQDVTFEFVKNNI